MLKKIGQGGVGRIHVIQLNELVNIVMTIRFQNETANFLTS